jgi:hypothetical protein
MFRDNCRELRLGFKKNKNKWGVYCKFRQRFIDRCSERCNFFIFKEVNYFKAMSTEKYWRVELLRLGIILKLL